MDKYLIFGILKNELRKLIESGCGDFLSTGLLQRYNDKCVYAKLSVEGFDINLIMREVEELMSISVKIETETEFFITSRISYCEIINDEELIIKMLDTDVIYLINQIKNEC